MKIKKEIDELKDSKLLKAISDFKNELKIENKIRGKKEITTSICKYRVYVEIRKGGEADITIDKL